MRIKQATKDVIALVEKLSDRRVSVSEDPSLRTLATVRTARGAHNTFHQVRYRPAGDTVNYLIVYQLGFLVRLFSCPPDQRWEIASSEGEHKKAMDFLGLEQFPRETSGFLISNLITQFRTFSVGIRVDDWIENKYPELHDEQRESIRQQLIQNQQVLSPQIREQFPKPLVDANTSMNAAFAKIWSDQLGESRYFFPYEALGYSDVAVVLCRMAENVSSEPTADRQLEEAWAEQLGIKDFFHFQRHTFDE